MPPPITQALLFDYFAGRLTTLQKEMIATWARDPANEEFFYECLHAWEIAHPQYLPDEAAALANYRRLLRQPTDQAGQPTQPVPAWVAPPRRLYQRWWSVAAIASLLLGLGLWLGVDFLTYQTYRTDYGETRQLQLPDGSVVVLNANSSLKVPRFGFGQPARQVFLQGEACFSIVHTPQHQRFVVKTDSLFHVEVLGTEFTVYARSRQKRVVLTRGEVQVQYRPEKQPPVQVTMKPGDLMTLDSKGQLRLKKVSRPESFAAWTRNQFIFDNTSLLEISEMLHNNYGLQVEIEGEQLATQTLTGSFGARTADELLAALTDILEVKVVRQGNRVVLSDLK